MKCDAPPGVAQSFAPHKKEYLNDGNSFFQIALCSCDRVRVSTNARHGFRPLRRDRWTSFAKTLAVRKLNPEARELADLYFFETLVRIHRAGEGAPYTGLKPAGRDLGPAIPAADKAIETGALEPLLKLITSESTNGLREGADQPPCRKADRK